jgi:hypothetical protein
VGSNPTPSANSPRLQPSRIVSRKLAALAAQTQHWADRDGPQDRFDSLTGKALQPSWPTITCPAKMILIGATDRLSTERYLKIINNDYEK